MDTTQTRNLLIDELLEVQAGFISIVLNYFFGLLLSIKGLLRGAHLTLFYFQKLLSVELLRSQSWSLTESKTQWPFPPFNWFCTHNFIFRSRFINGRYTASVDVTF